MKSKFQFSIADIMLLTAAIGVYLGTFLLAWDSEHKLGQSLMIAGGSVLFLGKISQVLCSYLASVTPFEGGRFIAIYGLLGKMERHSAMWLLVAVVGMVAIMAKL